MRRCAVTILLTLAAVMGCTRHLPREDAHFHLSLLQLLVHPERLAPGQGVAVFGFFSAERGANPRLYLTEAHALAEDVFSSVVVAAESPLKSTPCVDRFVRVYGSFEQFGVGYIVNDVSKIEIARVERNPNVLWIPEVCYRRE
jgi:hypothetical protein